MYTNMLRYKEKLCISKKKLTKDKVIPNHVKQNQVLDMANFEINFLSKSQLIFTSNFHGNVKHVAYYNFHLSIFEF